MMHQAIETVLDVSDRPIRDTVIQKDEIISITIDLHLLTADEFIARYCYASEKRHPLRISYKNQ